MAAEAASRRKDDGAENTYFMIRKKMKGRRSEGISEGVESCIYEQIWENLKIKWDED